MSKDDGLEAQGEIVAVWEEHPDEQYRQDQSHWRGAGRWTDEQWLRLGRAARDRVRDLYTGLGRSMSDVTRPAVLEWGPGGGANAYALADWAADIHGVDISKKNLDECSRVVAERQAAAFHPILLVDEPASITRHISHPVDLFLSTAVFQHFPSRDYGRQVLEAVRSILAPDGVCYVQIRYDDGNPKYAPKPLTDYRRSHITANSYGIAEFWEMLIHSGFRPLKISNLNTTINYAAYYFTVAPPVAR